MSEPIIVSFEETGLTKNGHKVYTTIEGQKYYVNKDKNIQITLHSPAKLLCSVQDIGGKKLHWINWAGPADQADQHTPKPITQPMPPKTSANMANPVPTAKTQSKYTDEDRKAFDAKRDQINHIAAMNNAVGMINACARSSNEGHFTGMNIAEVVKYWKDLERSFEKEFYARLSGNSGVGKNTSNAGDGIEVAEDVTSEEYNSGEAMD